MNPSLNPQQAAAVNHKDGPLLVVAGAGTGKTRVVTERIARLIRGGVEPKNILAVTFTNKAAGEMRERLERIAATGAPRTRARALRELTACTFHSLCVRILRRNPEVLGYRPGFTICDQGEQMVLVRKAARTVRGSAAYPPEDLLDQIGSWKNEGLGHEFVRRRAVEEAELVAAGVFRRYQESLKRLNAFDFDDLLVQSLALLKKSDEALAHWRDRFRYLLVDEFQDTNAVQYELVQRLAAPRDNLCVVGDDDQSIYAWRGAAPANLLEFPRRYPAATVVTLEQNYRSVNNVLAAANAVIAKNEERRPKNLRSALGDGEPLRLLEAPDQFDEALRVVDDMRARLERAAREGGEKASGAAPGHYAVILRANQQGRYFEEELRNARLPYVVIGGQRFFDREEARDVLAYLAVVANPDADTALLRIANTPARGLGEKSLDALAEHARAVGSSLTAAFAAPELAGLAGKAAQSARELAARFDAWRALARRGELENLVGTILKDIGYEAELNARHDDPIKAADRYQVALDIGASLRRFLARERDDKKDGDASEPSDAPDSSDAPASPDAASAKAKASASASSSGGGGAVDGLEILARFAQDAALWGDGDGAGDREERAASQAVKLITGHSAKGLEFDHVYIPGVEEGVWPHKNTGDSETSVAEERRLFYVALTRARRTLTLSRCLARTSRGKGRTSEPSRFLADIPPELLRTEGAYLSDEELGEWLAGMAKAGNG